MFHMTVAQEECRRRLVFQASTVFKMHLRHSLLGAPMQDFPFIPGTEPGGIDFCLLKASDRS